MKNKSIEKEVNSFFKFLNVENQEQFVEKMEDFFSDKNIQGQKEAIYDRGQLLLLSDGKQVSRWELESENDRVVKFDGSQITEINPYAYIQPFDMEMKGDNSKKRSGSGSSSSLGSNNNNNNNNNG